MKTSYLYYFLLIFVLLFGCNSRNSTVERQDKLSLTIANIVASNCDKLHTSKLSYEVAFLSQIIDKLGHIDSNFSTFLEDNVDAYVNDDGTIIFSDSINTFYPTINLITLYKRTGDDKYKRAIEKYISEIENNLKKGKETFKGYDAFCMSNIFLVQYAKEFNKHQWFSYVTNRMIKVYSKEKNELLIEYFDDIQESDDINNNIIIGKYLVSVVDVLEFLPKNHSNYKELISILNTSFEIESSKYKKDGIWTMGQKKDIDLETSLMISYSFAKSANNRYLPESYINEANKIFDSIKEEFELLEEEETYKLEEGICKDDSPFNLALLLMTAIELDK